MSESFPLLVTAHSERWCHVWNLQNIVQGRFDPEIVYQHNLEKETSSLACFGDGKGFAIGGIEGRVSVIDIDLSLANDKKISVNFNFKSHREKNK